jgi:hypothetical protein
LLAQGKSPYVRAISAMHRTAEIRRGSQHMGNAQVGTISRNV